MRKVRSWHFIVSGGIGGFLGFLFMDADPTRFATSYFERIGALAWYFGGFGLAVGAALGMTEGVVRDDAKRLYYGMLVGAALGVLAGFVGGGIGQAVYELLPEDGGNVPPNDIAIALDSSGSMSQGGWIFRQGNDVDGKRKTASARLIRQLSPLDRVAIIDFDHEAQVLFPLTQLNSKAAQKAALKAVKRVDEDGHTNLDAGLLTAIEQLSSEQASGRHADGSSSERRQHLIFLTDGVGAYTPTTALAAREKGIIVYTIGLGSNVDSNLLRGIAHSPKHYFPVENADDLIQTFQTIFSQNMSMIGRDKDSGDGFFWGLLRYLLRIVSWLIVGLAIGFGQGIRENTREDLFACSLGGLVGGALGGALFDPISSGLGSADGFMGRLIGDIVVGAFIGGSMRLAQKKLVDDAGTPRTTLLDILPTNPGLVILDENSEEKNPPPSSPTGPLELLKNQGKQLHMWWKKRTPGSAKASVSSDEEGGLT